MRKIQFSHIEGSLRGLLKQAVLEFEKYLPSESDAYHWVSVDQPELMAHALEQLASDLPEEDLAQIVKKMPYLFLLFRKGMDENEKIHIESLFAFLASLGQAGLFTVMRSISTQNALPDMFDLDPRVWNPHVFVLSGKVDLQYYHNEGPQHANISFFGDEGRLF